MICDLTHLGKGRKHWNTSWSGNKLYEEMAVHAWCLQMNLLSPASLFIKDKD